MNIQTLTKPHVALACRTLVLGLALGVSVGAQAATVQYNSRAGLAGTDSLSWVQLGADITTLSALPVAVVTTAMANATVANTAGDLTRADEAGLNSGFTGDFAPGAALLGTFGNAGPISISFANPVARVGTQFQSNEWGAFSGFLSAYDAANTLLGTVSFSNGVSGFGQLDTARFLGIGSSALNIASVQLSVTGTPNNDFWINTVSLSNQVVVTAVPEPSSYMLAAVGMLVLGGATLRQRRQKNSLPLGKSMQGA